MNFWKSKTLSSSIGFAGTGVAFTVGNLLLARELHPVALGEVSLAIAFFNVCTWLAPLGLDQLILRHKLHPGFRLLVDVATSCVVVAILTALITKQYWGFSSLFAMLIGVAIFSGGISTTAGLGLRRYGHEILSMMATNIASWTVLLCGLVSVIIPSKSADFAFVMLAVTSSAAGFVAWITLASSHPALEERHNQFNLGERASLLSIVAADVLLLQIERLIIPQTLGIEALASFVVLAAVAIFPFRLLRAGSSFGLIPRLRRMENPKARRDLIKREALAQLAMAALATGAALVVVPTLVVWITGGRYAFDRILVCAACLNGAAKLLDGLPRTVLVACGTVEQVAKTSWLNWLAIGASIVGALLCSPWGLAALLCGAAVGSLLGSWPAVILAIKVMGQP